MTLLSSSERLYHPKDQSGRLKIKKGNSKVLKIGKVIEEGLMRKQPKVGTASKAPAYKLLASLLKRDP